MKTNTSKHYPVLLVSLLALLQVAFVLGIICFVVARLSRPLIETAPLPTQPTFPASLSFEPPVFHGTTGSLDLRLDQNGQKIQRIHLTLSYPAASLALDSLQPSEALCPALTRILTITAGRLALDCVPASLADSSQISSLLTFHWQGTQVGGAVIKVGSDSTVVSKDGHALLQFFPEAHGTIEP